RRHTRWPRDWSSDVCSSDLFRADGGAFFVFASDLNPTVFGSGAGFTLIANFADGTSASASASVPLIPTIGSVSPSSGVQGASLRSEERRVGNEWRCRGSRAR